MGRIFVVELEGRSYRCKFCGTHLAHPDQLVSKSFHSRGGKAYLFNNVLNMLQLSLEKEFKVKQEGVPNYENSTKFMGYIKFSHLQKCPDTRVNITVGAPEERTMFSGLHIVADIFCCCCGGIIGWKYEVAHELNQKYKEGKFVLERGRIVGEMDLSAELFIDTHHE